MADSLRPFPKKPGKSRLYRERGLLKKHRPAVGADSSPEGVRLERVRVVLVSPQGAGNVGQVARAMLNMGLTRLYLVTPTPRYRSPESRQMAVGAWEILKKAKVCASIEQALEGAAFSVAFTADKGRFTVPVKPYEDYLPRVVDASQSADVALVFGTEVSGLSNDEIYRCHVAAKLLTSDKFSSMNLAQAVLVASFQTFSFRREPTPQIRRSSPASHDQLEGFFAHLREVLDRTKFLPQQNPDKFFNQLRALYSKLPLEEREIRILRGILSHFEWNLDNPEKVGPGKNKKK